MAGLGTSVELFRVFGFPVRVHASWLIIFVLLSWSLATGWFPSAHPGLGSGVYWTMGVVGSLGLFVSILLHELSHALVARRFGVPMRGITLFLFGGVAEMGDEPSGPRAELLIALAGPIASVGIAGACWAFSTVGRGLGWPVSVTAVTGYLALLNGVLAVFNLLPAFPLDGGRVFRALLWQWKGSLRQATRIAAQWGAAVGTGLILLGLLWFINGAVVSGLWFALIGMFLRGAAQSGLRHVELRSFLGGEPVRRFAETRVVTVSPEMTVQELVDRYVFRHHFNAYPVVLGDRLLGIVTLRQVKALPKDRWSQITIGEVLVPASLETTIGPDQDALEALERMVRAGLPRLMVVQDGRLAGMLSLSDLMAFFQLKLELDPEDE